MKQNSSKMAAAILRAAYDAWQAAAGLRKARARNKRFTYGDQWGDVVRDSHGALVTDYDRYCIDGSVPVTNNLLRQLVKTVVGRFRAQYLHKNASIDSEQGVTNLDDNVSALDELDSRALEEFLISGCCIQRIDTAESLDSQATVSNVNLNRFFVNQFNDPLGRDIELIGQLHDLPVSELLRRVARGDRSKAAWVRRLYSTDADNRTADFITAIGADNASGTGFWRGAGSKCRAIEVWTLESHEVVIVHDRKTATVTVEPVAALRRLQRDKSLDLRWDIVTRWHCRWYSPMGDLLLEQESPLPDGQHPFVVKFYPLTDGEVHAFIEDVIDQQKYVNRLITLIDHIMQASAKGVLMYPETALPDGFSWEDIRKVWRQCNGILPYSPTMGGDRPQQISSNNTDIGAFDMIELQLKLLEDISGVGGALQGRNINTAGSVTLYRSEVMNASIALTDVFDTFNAWRHERDARLTATSA